MSVFREIAVLTALLYDISLYEIFFQTFLIDQNIFFGLILLYRLWRRERRGKWLLSSSVTLRLGTSVVWRLTWWWIIDESADVNIDSADIYIDSADDFNVDSANDFIVDSTDYIIWRYESGLNYWSSLTIQLTTQWSDGSGSVDPQLVWFLYIF